MRSTYAQLNKSVGTALRRGGAALAFTYNEANRLVQVANNNTPVAAFAHNFLGERVAKSAGGTTTHFHYDRSGRLLAESDGSGNLLREHIWLDDMPIGFVAAGTLYFVHPDHLNTPQRLTDATGAVVWDQSLRPFGEVQASTFGLAENLRFPGQYADAETGLNYNFFRDYDPTIGRYVESDPIGLGGGMNTYAYGMVNPLTKSDSLGLLTSGEVSPPQSRPAIGHCADSEACAEQAEKDEEVCRRLPNKTKKDINVRRRCWSSVTERYAACIRGKTLPPLVTGDDEEDSTPKQVPPPFIIAPGGGGGRMPTLPGSQQPWRLLPQG